MELEILIHYLLDNESKQAFIDKPVDVFPPLPVVAEWLLSRLSWPAPLDNEFLYLIFLDLS